MRNEGPTSFEGRFRFNCEEGEYLLLTESIATHEGTKYSMSIRAHDSAPDATPLIGYGGMNGDELKEATDFVHRVARGNRKIAEVVKDTQDYIIEKHSNRSQK